MSSIFYLLMTAYLFLLLLRLFLADRYFRKDQSVETEFHEDLYTVVQPILSGDPRLEEDLLANVRNSRTLRFLWLVDQADTTAQEVVRSIRRDPAYAERIKVLYFEEVPQSINPKIYKISLAIDHIKTPYMIVLDDDSVIDMAGMKELSQYENSAEELLITGIPHNYGTKNAWSKLLAAFVNGNSLISYFTMAEVGDNRSINGMFYILSVETAKKYNAFPAILEYLCDDLALAEYLTACGVRIVQSRMGVNVKTTIANAGHYFRQLRRWMLFSSVYMKRHFSFPAFSLILLPSSIPPVMMLMAIWMGGGYAGAVLAMLAVKACLLYRLRRRIVGKPEGIGVIGYEMISDLLVPVVYFPVSVGKPVIVWRGRKIRVSDGKIHYE